MEEIISQKKLTDLTIKDNFLFGVVMMDEKNCRDLLEMILGFPIERVEISKEKSIVYHPEYKGVRLNIYAKDEKHTCYNVEMQAASKPSLGKRSRYCHSQIDMELLLSGKDYTELPTTYVIFVEQCTAWPDSVDNPADDVNRGMSMATVETAPAKAISNTRTIIKAGAGPNAAVAVNAQSKNKEKAVELIELLNTNDELYRLITMGEEGVDYTWDEEDNFVLVDGKYNFNYNEWQIGQSYSPEFARGQYAKGEKGEIRKQTQQMIYDADKTAEISPLTGFVFESSKVKTQIANCSAVITEMLPGLASGSIDPTTELPRFLERLEDAGVNDIIAEKQAQLDKFNANK